MTDNPTPQAPQDDWTITTVRLSGVECHKGTFGDWAGIGDMRVTPEMTPAGNILYRAWSKKCGRVGDGYRGKAFRSFNAAKRAAEAAHRGR